MYQGLTADICRQAWEIVLASVVTAAHTEVTSKLAGSVVVLDPHTGKVLFEQDVDPCHEKASVYREIAHAKARVSWETGLSSREVQQEAPHLYRPGMTKWGGSAIDNRLVVGFSGVQAVFDEAISWSMIAWIIAICQNEMTKPGGVMESESSIIGR